MQNTPEAEPDEKGDPHEKIKQFECKICMELATEPVVTLCGHLFW
jgi:hypothetical protein